MLMAVDDVNGADKPNLLLPVSAFLTANAPTHCFITVFSM